MLKSCLKPEQSGKFLVFLEKVSFLLRLQYKSKDELKMFNLWGNKKINKTQMGEMRKESRDESAYSDPYNDDGLPESDSDMSECENQGLESGSKR